MTLLCRCRRPTTGSDVTQITWSRYTRADRRYLRLSAEGSRMESHLRAEHVAFWNHLIPTMLARQQDWMSWDHHRSAVAWMNVGFWTLVVVCVVLLALTAGLAATQARHSMLARRRKRGGATVSGGSHQAGAPGCKRAV